MKSSQQFNQIMYNNVYNLNKINEFYNLETKTKDRYCSFGYFLRCFLLGVRGTALWPSDTPVSNFHLAS